MRTRSRITAVALLGAAATWLAGHAQELLFPAPVSVSGSPARTRFLLTDREAFLPFQPELVAEPDVLRAHWSPDARYVLAVRQEERLTALDGRPPEGGTSLVLWSRRDRHATVLWKQPLGSSMVQEAAWLPGTAVALAVVRVGPPFAPEAPQPGETRRELLRIDAARGVARSVAVLAEWEELYVSASQPVAVLARRESRMEGAEGQAMPREETWLRVVRAGGVGAPIRVPHPVYGARWTVEGRLAFATMDRADLASGRPPAERWHAFESATGALRALPGTPRFHEPEPPDLPVRLALTAQPVGKETPPEKVQTLWLESAVPGTSSRALLCGDSPWGMLAPDGSGVLYLSQGAAWVTPLLRMPKQAFLEARRAALKAVTMSNAKQVGLGLMMYIQDYDEVYPPSDETIVDRLRPYIRQEAVFNDPSTGARGFVYLHRESPAKEIEEPAKTPIGHITGPGGRAIIYADGHVVWEER